MYRIEILKTLREEKSGLQTEQVKLKRFNNTKMLKIIDDFIEEIKDLEVSENDLISKDIEKVVTLFC